MDKEKRNNYQVKEEYNYDTGKKFVHEPTGSATHINTDGRWEHDFYDHNDKKSNPGGTGDNPLAE